MAVIIERKSKFTPMPAGANAATISAVKDLGMEKIPEAFVAANRKQAEKEGRDPSKVPTEQRKIEIYYTDEAGNEAREKFTASTHSKSTLFKRISAIIGEAPGQTFDVESLVGTPVTVLTEEKTSASGNTYAKVLAVTKRKAAGSVKTAAPVAATAPVAYNYITDEDIPF